MKNLRYFTFERNKYFYGKLLSVDDFETEQRYMNDKRRIINRFVHGAGVVCGMNVVPVDDITVSVEMGLALDFAGREIMIEQPVIKRLSMIDGFDDYTEADEENSSLYLCIEYAETEKDPVHSIAGMKEGQKLAYNKYTEGYHLYLTNQEPENEEISNQALYEETKTIYWKNGIRIKQTVPKYVTGNNEFELKICVENMGQTKPISFQYDLNVSCIQGGDKVTISFDEREFTKAKQYAFTKKLIANAVSGVTAKLSVVENSFQLAIGGMNINAEAKGTSSIQIISGHVKQEIMNQYYYGAMEGIVKNANQHKLYLAKILMIRAGTTYVIDSVEPMPFKQYLYNNTLASVMNQLSLMEEQKKGNITGYGLPELRNATAGAQMEQFKVATGTVVLDLGIGGATGQKFFSEEIAHGLGLGPVHITLGQAYTMRDDSEIVFGAVDIFEDSRTLLQADMAVKVNVEKGTFVIGVRCLEPTTRHRVKIHWTAMKDVKEIQKEQNEVVMQIRPDMLNLSVRDTYYFEAMIGGKVESRIKWSVQEIDGGTIDKNGMYTAPNKVGVYEIVGESMDYPEFKASTFVVVRDKAE